MHVCMHHRGLSSIFHGKMSFGAGSSVSREQDARFSVPVTWRNLVLVPAYLAAMAVWAVLIPVVR